MLQDQKFLASFEAWHDMDRQLRTQFIDSRFIIDPTCTIYSQLFKCSHMDAFLAQSEKLQQQHPFRGNNSFWGGHQDSSHVNNNSLCYNPYEKDAIHSRSNDPLPNGHKPTMCLQCSTLGHRASSCSAMKSSRPERPINCDWKANKLVSKSKRNQNLHHLQHPWFMHQTPSSLPQSSHLLPMQ